MKSEPPQRRPSTRGEHPAPAVRNLQRRHRVDGRRLKAFLSRAASAIGEGAPLTLALVNDSRMRTLNREFRGRDEPTDVLSFRSSRTPEADPYLGDIVISVETAERQARRLGSTLRRELEILSLHGFLHLLGYDHETDRGEMRRIEYRLRRKLGLRRPRRSTVQRAPAHSMKTEARA